MDPTLSLEQRLLGRLLAAIESCEAGKPLLSLEPAELEKPGSLDDAVHVLYREVRRLRAARAYEQAIDRLDAHCPPEWAVLDAMGARVLRLLGQAYLGLGNLPAARDCWNNSASPRRNRPCCPVPNMRRRCPIYSNVIAK